MSRRKGAPTGIVMRASWDRRVTPTHRRTNSSEEASVCSISSSANSLSSSTTGPHRTRPSGSDSLSSAPGKDTCGPPSSGWQRRCSLPRTNSTHTAGFPQRPATSRPLRIGSCSYGRIFTDPVMPRPIAQNSSARRPSGCSSWVAPHASRSSAAFSGLLEDFAQWMTQERGLSPHTIRKSPLARRADSSRGSTSAIARWRSCSCGTSTRTSQRCTRKGLSRVTIKIHTDAVRAFLRHAERRAWCSAGLADTGVRSAHLSAPRAAARTVLGRRPGLIERRRPTRQRTSGIARSPALRRLRLARRRSRRPALDDVDWEQDRLIVPRTKQGRRHVYPLLPSVGQAIIRYLQDVRPPCCLSPGVSEGPRADRADDLEEPLCDRRRALEALGNCGVPLTARTHCDTPAPDGSSPKACRSKRSAITSAIAASTSTRVYAKVDLHGLREVAAFDLGEVV